MFQNKNGRKHYSPFLQKNFDNTTCFTLLQRLRFSNQNHSLKGSFISFHILLAQNAFHFSVACFNLHQNVFFFSFAMRHIHCLSPFPSIFSSHYIPSIVHGLEGAVQKSLFTHFHRPWLPTCYPTTSAVSSECFGRVLNPFTSVATEDYFGCCGPLKSEKCLVTAAFDCLVDTDVVLCSVTHLVFDCVHSLVLNFLLYSEGKHWPDLFEDTSRCNQLPQVFQNQPGSPELMFGVIGRHQLHKMILSCTRVDCRLGVHLSKLLMQP